MSQVITRGRIATRLLAGFGVLLVLLLAAGIVGWTLGVVSAGVITGWQWDGLEMVLLALLLGTLFTMIAALGIDLLAPMGSLATGDQAGLFSLRNPLKGVATRCGRFAAIGRFSIWPG